MHIKYVSVHTYITLHYITLHLQINKYIYTYIYDPVSRIRCVHGSSCMVWGVTTPTAPTPQHIHRRGYIDIHRYRYMCVLYIYTYIHMNKYLNIHILHTYMHTHVYRYILLPYTYIQFIHIYNLYISIYLAIYPFTHLHVYLSVYLSIYLSI